MERIKGVLAFCVGLWAVYALIKGTQTMIDPLKYSSLADADIRMYRYLHALQEISGVKGPAPSLNVQEIREYLATHKAVMCSNFSRNGSPGCDRMYINEITKCPVDGFSTISVPQDIFMEWVYKWEAFRQRYTETSRIRGLTRVWAVKMSYIMAHPLEA